jgi:hypothetical protein
MVFLVFYILAIEILKNHTNEQIKIYQKNAESISFLGFIWHSVFRIAGIVAKKIAVIFNVLVKNLTSWFLRKSSIRKKSKKELNI